MLTEVRSPSCYTKAEHEVKKSEGKEIANSHPDIMPLGFVYSE
jgi:hypothetical protein